MAFYEHIFAFSLVLVLSLSSTDTSLAARHLLDTGADSSSTPALIQSTIPPLIQPKFPNVGLPVFQTLPMPKMPATLPSTQIPSPPTRPVGSNQSVTYAYHSTTPFPSLSVLLSCILPKGPLLPSIHNIPIWANIATVVKHPPHTKNTQLPITQPKVSKATHTKHPISPI